MGRVQPCNAAKLLSHMEIPISKRETPHIPGRTLLDSLHGVFSEKHTPSAGSGGRRTSFYPETLHTDS